MSWTEADVREMHRRYREEKLTLDQIGAEHGVTKERVRQLFSHYGLPSRTSGDIAEARRQALQERTEGLRPQIEALYREHGTLEAIYDRVDLPKGYVREVVANMPNREAYRRRGGAVPRISIEQIRAALRKAAEIKGEPLTLPAYREAATELGLPAYETVIKPYGGVFAEACKDAGVRCGEPKGPYRGTTTREECIEAVLECVIAFNGERPSFPAYSLWAKDNSKPSGPTVRLRCDGWNSAVTEALDRYAAMH